MAIIVPVVLAITAAYGGYGGYGGCCGSSKSVVGELSVQLAIRSDRIMAMNQGNPSSSENTASAAAFEKLKSTVMLGIGSNFFTFLGMLCTWILVERTGWVQGFWAQATQAVAVAPAFLSDSLNSYVLGRIRLDVNKNWDDIQMTAAGKQKLVQWHFLWRLLSFTTSALLALHLVAMSAPNPGDWAWVRCAFLAAFLLHCLRCFFVIRVYIAPRLPVFGGAGLRKRMLGVGFIGAGWFLWLLTRDLVPFGRLGAIFHGTILFLICGAMQPLPSRYSIFHPGRVTRPRPLMVVQELSDDDIASAGEAIRHEVQNWCGQHQFTSVGSLRMPLLELPLFQASGTMLVSDDRIHLLLILQSDVRKRVHRTILTYSGAQLFMTTDFGAPEARFPDHILYLNLPTELSPADFFRRHQERLPASLTAFPAKPTEALQTEVEQMFSFLHNATRKAAPEAAIPESEEISCHHTEQPDEAATAPENNDDCTQ